VVVIGRNEGERLARCIASVRPSSAPLVYVDSSSSDGSPERARKMGAEVVNLPLDRPFTAGRARNLGFRRLLEVDPTVELVQFVDGDCEVEPGWLEAAGIHLQRAPRVASVCGRRRERAPEASIYNRLCDLEWDTPIGAAEATGGDFMTRAAVFDAVGGFDESLIAGEEPELCHRIRRAGWQIERLDAAMSLHDAAIVRFSQWARRSARAGYANAAGALLHLGDGSAYRLRENARSAFWGLALPALSIIGTLSVSAWFGALGLLYPIQLARIWWHTRARHPEAPALASAVFTSLGKFAEAWGQALFLFRWLTGTRQRIIEYKSL
jgi:GT2 family glycosyltransferase